MRFSVSFSQDLGSREDDGRTEADGGPSVPGALW